MSTCSEYILLSVSILQKIVLGGISFGVDQIHHCTISHAEHTSCVIQVLTNWLVVSKGEVIKSELDSGLDPGLVIGNWWAPYTV